MSDETDGPTPAWPPAAFARSLQEASEQAIESQQEMVRRMMDPGGVGSQLGAMSRMAMFKTRVQSGGRISIPDAEREALDIEEGDIVQTVVVPVKRNRRDSDE
jgi:hypothetical protein